jgi:DNA-binding HxlR family transcriptional regulator
MPRPRKRVQSDCPLADLIDIIGGRWKVLSLWHLRDGTKRFTELKRLMPGVTQKMLTQQLRQLEADGLVSRKVYPQVPPKVEYRLTPAGEELGGLLLILSGWAKDHMPALEAGRSGGERPAAATS